MWVLLAASLLCRSAPRAASMPRTAWIFESEGYTSAVRAALATSWHVEWCGPPPAARCNTTSAVDAVVGRADSINLTTLPALGLVQSPSYFHTAQDRVPLHAAIAAWDDWPTYGNEEIAEFAIAAVFQHVYRLGERAARFRHCAWDAHAASSCDPASSATNHTMVSDLTVGIVGYGHIGQAVARRAAALGATVVATALHADPSQPPPAPLAWLSKDNDRLYRVADVVVVTVPGSVVGLINGTALAMMRDGTLLIPVSANPIDFGDLLTALTARPSLSAVVDVWPDGGAPSSNMRPATRLPTCTATALACVRVARVPPQRAQRAQRLLTWAPVLASRPYQAAGVSPT